MMMICKNGKKKKTLRTLRVVDSVWLDPLGLSEVYRGCRVLCWVYWVCPSLNWLCKRLINWWIAMLKWQQFSEQQRHRQTMKRSIMW